MSSVDLMELDRAARDRLRSRDFEKNFLVSAGAGAGKTYLTVERAFHMLCDPELDVKPQDIVMITFTRKAATEMKTRLNRWIRNALDEAKTPAQTQLLRGLLSSLPEMQISTIHSFCRRVLMDYPLESGVGFAPQFAPEEGGPDSLGARYFDEAWRSGRCRESLDMSIRREIVEGAFNDLNARASVQPQYLDPASKEGRAVFRRILRECEDLIARFRRAAGGMDPGTFHPAVGSVLQRGGDAPRGAMLTAARYIVSHGKVLREWMGKNSRKTARLACETLEKFLSGADAAEARDAVEGIFAVAAREKGRDRRSVVLEMLPRLPASYRAVAEFAESLPGEDALSALKADIDSVIHGLITAEARALCLDYAEYRRNNHIVSLDDMLSLTAELVRKNPGVRQELHRRYRVFFVDEYQDTDPVQTDILFAITAERYDPDWHRCIPRPGSLFLVGDARQGIYRFRGADISLWQEAEEALRATGGEVVNLYRNYRSTTQICEAVKGVFGEGGSLPMAKSPYQAAYSDMAAQRGNGPEAVFHHTISCSDKEEGFAIAAKQVAQMIQDRVRSGQNRWEDFLLLSFFKEKRIAYADELRRRQIPVKFDGSLSIDAYRPILLLNLRVQAVCHPFDETLSFRVLNECCGVSPEEWDLFRMEVHKLPEETMLSRYRDTRSLMGHVDELSALLRDTPVNRRVLAALKMLNRDRQLSQQRTPCAFLEEVVETSEGLFVESYDAKEFQNQYAALLQTIDSIRSMNPQQFVDMAEMLTIWTADSLDRMPSIRSDSDFVRLMNLHKAKGLQGKVVIFLPGQESAIRVDSNVRRDGLETRGWFVIKEGRKWGSVRYEPQDWEARKAEEEKFLQAERIRLEYVALTRAEDEAHVFDLRVEKDHGKSQTLQIWKGFDAVGRQAPEIAVAEAEPVARVADPEAEENARTEQLRLREGLAAVVAPMSRRVTPSDLDRSRLRNEPVEGMPSIAQAGEERGTEGPGGTAWGTLVHRAAELAVSDHTFSAQAIEKAARRAVTEQFQSELLSRRDRSALCLPESAATLQEIHAYLTDALCARLQFMIEPASPFRRMLQGATCYPELPFSISVTEKDGALLRDLQSLTHAEGVSRLEIAGKIDLALRYDDGTWRVLDYKTDRMLPIDEGSAERYRARLQEEYGVQLEIYRRVLAYLTGERVRDAALIPI